MFDNLNINNIDADNSEDDILKIMDNLKLKMKKFNDKSINKNNSDKYQPEVGIFMKLYENMKDLLETKDCRKKEFKESLECFIKKIKINIKKKDSCSKDALDNENKFIEHFNSDNLYRKNVLNMLGIYYDENDYDKYNDYICEKPKKIKETSEWTNFKKGTKGKKTTPKTDVVIKNKNNDYLKGISIKSGKGRITSGDAFETNALFRTVLNNSNKYKDDVELNKLVDDLFNTMSGERYNVNNKNITFTYIISMKDGKIEPTTEEEINSLQWYSEKIKEYEKCNNIWKELREKYKDYCIDIIKEGFQGKYKFGDNIGTADILLTLKGCTTTIISVLHFVDELAFDKHANDVFNNAELKGNVFATKTASDKKGRRKFWTRFL